jgi:hypothetical protein
MDHFVAFGEALLRHILTENLVWYHQCRPHQALGNKPLQVADPPLPAGPGTIKDVVCEERLGVLLKRYYRQAA